MADKTPVRVVFNASNVATGMAEFQSGETVGTSFGGTGLTAIGSAGQVLKVNAAGSALEFSNEGDISIQNIVAPTNSDFTISTSGTGNIILDSITVRGTTLSSSDSSSININEGLIVDGTLSVSGQATLSGLAFPTSDGSANQFLKTDGSGTLSFADVSLGDFSFIGSTISNSSNADLTLDPSGTGSVKLNAATDITGATTITTTTTDDSLLITSTEASNSAAPVVTLKRNSSSPADADYIGRIKFKGENDADQEVQYGSISGKILDASDGSEDGAIELNVKKAGSNVIAVRLNSDELKLLNGTTLDVDGAGTFAGAVTATSVTTNDIVSNGSNADINLDPTGTGTVQLKANTTITGNLTVSGTQTTLETTTLVVEDPLLELAKNNSGGIANSMDQGLFLNRGSLDNVSFLWDESADEFVAAVTSGEDGTTSGNVTIDSYAGLQVGVLKATTGTFSSTLAVTGAATFTGDVTTGALTTNNIVSNGSNADINIEPQGTGKVVINNISIDGELGNITTDASAMGLTIDTNGAGDINLTAGADVNIPANIGLTFGDDGEKIEGDGTDLTINSSGDVIMKLTGEQLILHDGTSNIGQFDLTGNHFLIEVLGNEKDMVFKGYNSGSTLTALTLDMSEAGAATFNDDITVGDNLNLTTDSSVITFGADSDTTLTHTDGTGLTLNSTNKLCFNDTGTFIHSNADGDLDLSSDGTNNDAIKITSAGGITLDANNTSATGVINLDAHYHGYVGLKDNGTTYGNFTNLNASNFNITSSISDADMVFRGNDGGVTTTALTLDMSAAGAATFNSTVTVGGAMTATSVIANDITSNGSNANIDIAPQGSGKVQFNSAYTFPTSDGSNGNALVTDGSGTLSFGTVGDPSASDLADAVARNDKRLLIDRPRVIDKFDMTYFDSALYYVVTNDYTHDIVNIQKLSVIHDNSTAGISGVGINGSDSVNMPTFTADVSGSLVVVKGEMNSDDSTTASGTMGGSVSFLRLALGDNSSAATSGNTQLIINADVDSASESFDTFAHASYRGAKYFFSVNNDSKTELENFEVMVVHDGSDAYMTQYGGVRTGDNTLIVVTAAISGSNVVVSVAGLEPNLRVTANIIRLKDTMVSDAGTYGNTEAIAPATISSTATAIAELDTVSKGNGAVFYVVGKNATEGAFSISEVFLAVNGDGTYGVASPGHVSTKGTDQLSFTADFKDDAEATVQLLASSTSGGSTTCSSYRINVLAK